MDNEHLEIYRVEILRKNRCLSRKDLADAIGVNESTIFRLEQRKHVSNMKMLIQLANVLDCDISYLLNVSNEVRKRREK